MAGWGKGVEYIRLNGRLGLILRASVQDDQHNKLWKDVLQGIGRSEWHSQQPFYKVMVNLGFHAETDTMQTCKLHVLEVDVVAQPLSIQNAHGTAVLYFKTALRS